MSEPLSKKEEEILRSIVRGFTAAEWRALKALASGIATASGGTAAGGSGEAAAGDAAPDAELRGRYGNPKVRKDPKFWAGAPYVGANYSQCPSEYLIVLAESLEYFADREQKKPSPKVHKNGTPFWKFDLKDARLARGWARRNQGRHFDPPPQAPVSVDDPYRDDGSDFVDSSEASDSSEWAP